MKSKREALATTLLLLLLLSSSSTGGIVDADGDYKLRLVQPEEDVNDNWFNPRVTGKAGNLAQFAGAGATASLRINHNYDLYLFTNVIFGGYNTTGGPNGVGDKARVCNPGFQYHHTCNASSIGRMPFTTWGVWDRNGHTMTYSPELGADWLQNPAWNPANTSIRFYAKAFAPFVQKKRQVCIIGDRIDLPPEDDPSIPPKPPGSSTRNPYVHRDLPLPYIENGTYIVCFEDVELPDDSPPDPSLWKKSKWLPHRMAHTGPDALAVQDHDYQYHFGDSICAPAFEGGCFNKQVDPNGPEGQFVYVFGSRKAMNKAAGEDDAQIVIRMNINDIWNLNGDAYDVYTDAVPETPFVPNSIGALANAKALFRRSVKSFNMEWSHITQSYVVLLFNNDDNDGVLEFHTAPQPFGTFTYGEVVQYLPSEDSEPTSTLPVPFRSGSPNYARCTNVQLHSRYSSQTDGFVQPDSSVPEDVEQWPFLFTCLPTSIKHLDVMFKPPPFTELYRAYWLVLRIFPPPTPPSFTPRPSTLPPPTPKPLPPTPVPTLPTNPPTPMPTPYPPSAPTPENNIKVGIVCGSLLVVIVAAWIVFVCCPNYCKCCNKSEEEAEAFKINPNSQPPKIVPPDPDIF